GPHWPLIGLVVFLALVGVVLWGSLVGSLLPIVLKRLGADPAASSTPFVAPVVDVVGILVFFGIAKLVLTGVLLRAGAEGSSRAPGPACRPRPAAPGRARP